jgi:catechol 2,3-dioxygenase-like lactoylglutathione lyase family enzyme
MKPIQGMRINHLQVTIPRGSLAGIQEDLLAFYRDTLGFGVTSVAEFGPNHLFLTTDDEGSQFIYVSEHEHPAIIGGDDHLGFHVPTRAAVDAFLVACRALQSRDPRMEIRPLDDLDLPATVTHAFYFRFLLPIWFDVQVIEFKPGFAPAKRWVYSIAHEGPK